MRIKRLSDKGDYKVRVLTDKPLSAAALKKAMAQIEVKFPNGLEGLVLDQLKAQMERLKALEAMEDDDDEDDDETEDTPATRRGRPKAAAVEEEEEEDVEEDEDDDEDDEDEDVDDDASDEDEDEDEDEEEDADEEEEDEEEEDAKEISGGIFEVVSVNEREETFSLKDSDGKRQKMWLGEGIEVDWDSFTKGANATVYALQDDEGDWVVTSIAVKKARAARSTRHTRTRNTPHHQEVISQMQGAGHSLRLCLAPCCSRLRKEIEMALPMWTQTEIVDHLAEVTGFPKGEIRNVLAAQSDLVQDVMVNCERIKVAEITIEPKLRKATKKRMGRNPATGESIEISAKPASVVVKARVGKKLQEQVPSVQKLRKTLA